MKRAILLSVLLSAACSSGTGTGNAANVQVSFATQSPAGTTLSRTAILSDTLAQGTDTLVLTSVQVVLRQVELKLQESASCSGADSCEEFAAGPLLVSLPLTAGTQQQFALDIPPGTYDQVEFDVHKPDNGDPQDQAFIQANPAFATASIRVQGTFNGQAFDYTTDLDVQQQLVLPAPLTVVNVASATNLTVLVDVSNWFRAVDGSLIGPATANKGQPNEGLVAENIKNSFRAFEDQNKDGGQDP